jgi:hypothetical protein
VTCALQDAEKAAPWAYRFAVLCGQKPGELMQMGQVVRGPCGEKLGQSYGAKAGMDAAAFEVKGRQGKRIQLAETFSAETREFIEGLIDRAARGFADMSAPIEGRKGLRFAKLKDCAGAGHPVGSFAIDQVTEDLEGVPGAIALVAKGPRGGQASQECVERGWSARKQGFGVFEVEFHGNLDSHGTDTIL